LLESIMTIRLSSGSLVETVVTLAAAALMTLAGFEMLDGSTVTRQAPAAATAVAMPHVDMSRAAVT
jgi:hypothetical protein